jgi:hypothetical protein
MQLGEVELVEREDQVAACQARELPAVARAERRTSGGRPLVPVRLERTRRGGARVVIVPELESAHRAHLIGRPAKSVLVRGREHHIGGRRPPLVRRHGQFRRLAHGTCIHPSKYVAVAGPAAR